MGARREYVIDVVLAGEASGLSPLQRGLRDIEDRIGGLEAHDVQINANIGGNALEGIREIQGHLDSLDDRQINVNLGGNVEGQLRNIEGHLETIARGVNTPVNLSGDAIQEIRNVQGGLERLARGQEIQIGVETETAIRGITELGRKIEEVAEMSSALTTAGLGQVVGNLQHNTNSITEGLARGIQSVNSEIGKMGRELRSLNTGSTSGIGQRMANEFESAAYSVGKIQTELNSLKAPTITPQVQMPDMNQYYGSYDQLGHLNMGAIGGSSILSMIGVGQFKNVTYGNASKEQTNEVLLSRMDANEDKWKVSGKTYEGGTDTITHAVSQNRTVRNPDLISQLYAFQMATGATNEQLMSNVFGNADDTEWGQGSMVDVLAAFGESVALQTGSEQLGTSAMFDLAKAFGGQYASVDQYGISEETLRQHGYDPKSEDVTGFMKAVGEIIHADAPNELMETTEGGLTNLRKRFHRAGRQIGQIMMGPIDFLSSQLLKIDKTDFNFAGITIPKGTFSTTIIGITGLVSAIDPLQHTMRAIHDTFDKVTGAVKTAKDSLINLGETINNLGNLGKLRDFQNLGAEGILGREKYLRLNREEAVMATLQGVQQTKGVHDYTDTEIDMSKMTFGQKRLTKNAREFDSLLFDMEGGMSELTKMDIGRQARKELEQELEQLEYDETGKLVRGGVWTERARKNKELSKVERGGFEDYIRDSLMDDYVKGRKNQISQLSNWQKFKAGAKLSFDPQTSAFTKAFRKEKSSQKEGGIFNTLKNKTWGNLKGLKKGFDALRDTGGITNSLKSLGGVFTSFLGAINPVTVVMGVLTAGVAALGAIFAIAYANSEDFRKKVAELMEKIHDLFDTVIYTVGDLLKNSGLTEKGGAEGIAELATKIVDGISSVVEILQEILSAMGGRDLTVSKQTDKIEPNLEKKAESIKKKREEGEEVSIDEYRTLLNQSQQIMMMDPNYFTDQKIKDLGMDTFQDDAGHNFTDYLKRDYDMYGYYEETLVPKLRENDIQFEENGVKLSDKETSKKITEAIGFGDDAEEKKASFNRSYNEALLWEQTGFLGKKWEDTEFGKANPNLKVMDSENRDKKSHGMWDYIGSIVWWLEKIGWIVSAILALMAMDKAAGVIKAITEKGWKGAIDDFLTGKLGDAWTKTKGRWKSGKEDLGTIRDWWKNGRRDGKPDLPDKIDPKKKSKIDPSKTMDDIADELDDLKKGNKQSIKDMFKETNLGKKLGEYRDMILPDNGRIMKFSRRLRTALQDIGQNGILDWLGNNKRLNSIWSGITKRLPNLSWITERIGGEGIFATLRNTFGRITGWISKQLGKGFFARIFGWLGGRIGLNAIPVVGQIIDALWIAWDLASWIGDFLDVNIPWLGQIFAMVSPMRMIQKSWNDIVSAFQWGTEVIGNALRSIGLGFIVDFFEWVYTEIVKLVEWIQGIPVIGWLFGGEGNGWDNTSKEDKDTAKTNSETAKTNNETANAINQTEEAKTQANEEEAKTPSNDTSSSESGGGGKISQLQKSYLPSANGGGVTVKRTTSNGTATVSSLSKNVAQQTGSSTTSSDSSTNNKSTSSNNYNPSTTAENNTTNNTSDNSTTNGTDATAEDLLRVDKLTVYASSLNFPQTPDMNKGGMSYQDMWNSLNQEQQQALSNYGIDSAEKLGQAYNNNIATPLGQASVTDGMNHFFNTVPTQQYGITPLMNNGNPMYPQMPMGTNVGGMVATPMGTQPNSNAPVTINNNLHIEGISNSEELARMIVKVINERFLWDAQKAGRTVDGTPNLTP